MQGFQNLLLRLCPDQKVDLLQYPQLIHPSPCFPDFAHLKKVLGYSLPDCFLVIHKYHLQIYFPRLKMAVMRSNHIDYYTQVDLFRILLFI